MRFEELSVSDLRAAGAHCDTLLIVCGGMSSRPAHLPVGTSAFILRKLRDALEAALGGRVLSLPLWGFDAAEAQGAYAVLPDAAWGPLVQGFVAQIERDLKLSRIVVLTDSAEKETLLKDAVLATGHRAVTFVWWRDGLAPDATGGRAFVPGGELETALVMAIGTRLVDLTQPSVERFGAGAATVERGRALWSELIAQLRRSISE